jgi:hypothetical protein
MNSCGKNMIALEYYLKRIKHHTGRSSLYLLFKALHFMSAIQYYNSSTTQKYWHLPFPPQALTLTHIHTTKYWFRHLHFALKLGFPGRCLFLDCYRCFREKNTHKNNCYRCFRKKPHTKIITYSAESTQETSQISVPCELRKA